MNRVDEIAKKVQDLSYQIVVLDTELARHADTLKTRGELEALRRKTPHACALTLFRITENILRMP